MAREFDVGFTYTKHMELLHKLTTDPRHFAASFTVLGERETLSIDSGTRN